MKPFFFKYDQDSEALPFDYEEQNEASGHWIEKTSEAISEKLISIVKRQFDEVELREGQKSSTKQR